MILINDSENSDVFLPEDIFEEIAESVLTNLKDHPIIGQKIESFQQEHPDAYVDIVQDAADTIHTGITEYVDNNFYNEGTSNLLNEVVILTRSEAREELKKLFERNIDDAASS